MAQAPCEEYLHISFRCQDDFDTVKIVAGAPRPFQNQLFGRKPPSPRPPVTRGTARLEGSGDNACNRPGEWFAPTLWTREIFRAQNDPDRRVRVAVDFYVLRESEPRRRLPANNRTAEGAQPRGTPGRARAARGDLKTQAKARPCRGAIPVRLDQALLVTGTPRSCRQPAYRTALQASMRWCPDPLSPMISGFTVEGTWLGATKPT